MKRLQHYLFVVVGFLLTNCSTTPETNVATSTPAEVMPANDLRDVISVLSAEENRAAPIEESDLVVPEVAQAPLVVDPSKGDELSHLRTEIPMELNTQVRKWIRYFTKEDPERFSRFVGRGTKYRKMIETILVEHGVPKELYYLAFIESGFATQATSHASAVGIWQFIKGTGVRYGLTVNNLIDERRDPVLATHAAAQYLGDLFRVYQSWYLAMASYNAGEARIMNAIMRSNSRDFWQMVQQRALPNETMNYIPKFIAAVIVGENLEKYGFSATQDQEWTETAEIKVPPYLRLQDIAKATGVSATELAELNPALRRNHTVLNRRPTNLRIWQKDLDKFSENLASVTALPRSARIEELEVKNAVRSAIAATNKSSFYRVRRGDNLQKIAEANGVTVGELKAMNQLRSSKVIRGQKLLIAQAPVKNYRVRRGDNLQKIATRFGMIIKQLKFINRMSRSVVYPGQLLTVNDRNRSGSESL